MGLQHQKTHNFCRRCERMFYHKQKHTCSGCGYPAATARTRKCKKNINLDQWSSKTQNRKGTGTGRCKYLKRI